MERARAVVVGGGITGASVAYHLAKAGWHDVVLLEKDELTSGSTCHAAGLVTQFNPSPTMMRFRRYSIELYQELGVFETVGSLRFASSKDHMMELQRGVSRARGIGLDAELISATEAAGLMPAITTESLYGAVWMPGEHQVTPRRLLKVLRTACIARGVEIRVGQRVLEVLRSGNRVDAVRAGGERIPGGAVVIASGVWSAEIAGLRPQISVRPRKGQILSLAMQGQPFRRMIRCQHAYFVPRRDGELIVGATNEDAGFDRSLTPDGIGGLLGQAQQLSAHTASYPIVEMWTGLRPATPDGLPVLGPAGFEGLLYATGHYRNGILLAPITASIVASLVDGRTPDLSLEEYAPSRFEQPHSGDRV